MRNLIRHDDWGFEDLFDEIFKPVNFEKRAMSMHTDVKENENQYELDIDMPGFKKNEIDISIENGYLNVSAKKEQTEEQEEKGKNYTRRERAFFANRRYFVGDKVKEDDISAKYENGVLSLIVPKEKPKELTAHKVKID